VKGRNTRSCRVYFDSSPVYEYVVRPGRRLGAVASDEVEEAREYQDVFNVTAGSGAGMQEGYEVGPNGVKEVRLWSRTWEKELRVDVNWANSTHSEGAGSATAMRGRVACEWVEYESAMVDNGMNVGAETARPKERMGQEDGEGRAKIPALEEVLAFLPDWAAVSKTADGLVEASVPFEI